jgi:phospholipid/cholesterol/gamma-HCH transport system substrate-binding protein
MRIGSAIALTVRTISSLEVLAVSTDASRHLRRVLVSREGVLRYGPNLPGAVELPVRDMIAEVTGLPVIVDNDANVAGYGEVAHGAAKGARNAHDFAADRAVAKLDDVTTRAADAVASAVPEVPRTLDRVDHAIDNARARMHGVKDGLVSGLHDTREGLDRIDPQIAQAGEVMAAINEGHGDDWRGTLGHLINDPELGNTIADVTEAGRDAVASLNRFRTWLGLRVEFDVFSRQVRYYATAELHARNDKFYLVELERGPLGGLPNDSLSDVVGSTDFERRQVIHDEPRFTAQFGKHLGWFSVRGGLKDSTFGLGGDALLFQDRLKLSADLYGSFQPTPRLKIAAALAVFRSVYVLAGVDDALNKPGYLPVITGNSGAPQVFNQVRHGRDYFVGTTLVFTDADIAVLMRLYGALLISLL